MHRLALEAAGEHLDQASVSATEAHVVDAAVLVWTATVYSAHARYWRDHEDVLRGLRRDDHDGACLTAGLVHVRSSTAYDWAQLVSDGDPFELADDRWRDTWGSWVWRPEAPRQDETAPYYERCLAGRLIDHGIVEVVEFLTVELPDLVD